MRSLPLIALFVVAACGSAGPGQEAGDEAVAATSTQAPAPESTSMPTETSVALPPEAADLVIFRSPDLDREAMSIPILFTERACVSGSRADGRFELIVVEDEATIDVAVMVTPPPGVPTCLGNPWTPALVELSDPVGDRRIVGVDDPIDHGELLGARDRGSVQVVAQIEGELPAVEFIDAPTRFDGEVQCENVGLEIGFEVFTFEDRLGREGLLAEALVGIGGPYDGMFRVRDPFGSEQIAQFMDGTVVASIDLYRGEVGWGAQAYRCGDLPDGWVPDAEVPEPEGRMTPAPSEGLAVEEDVVAVQTILEGVNGIDRQGDGLFFVDPEQRCPAMIAAESALESAGWRLAGSQLWLDPLTGPGRISVDRQTDTLLIGDDGRALWLKIRPRGLVDVEAADQAYPSMASSPSLIQPCYLDIPVQVDVLDP